jgi:hypothetical protein
MFMALEQEKDMAIEVQLFTADYVIRGMIETDGERLTDVLNLKNEPALILTDVQAASLFTLGKAAPIRTPKARLEKKSILLAIPIERDLTHKSIFRKANRLGFEVAVLMPQFDIHGTIHMTEKMDIRKGVTTRPEDFIPLTDATVTFAPNPQLVLRADAVVFNKSQISLIGEIRHTGPISPPTGPVNPHGGE